METEETEDYKDDSISVASVGIMRIQQMPTSSFTIRR